MSASPAYADNCSGLTDCSFGVKVALAAAGIALVHVLLKFPPSDTAADLYEPGVATGVLKAVVDAFAPDWATFTSHALRNAQGAKPGDLTVGWLTYLTRPVPSVGTVEAYRSGSILILGPAASEVTGDQVSRARTALTMSL